MAAQPDFQHAREVSLFMKRVFSGHDLLQILELAGIGVGAGMHLVDTAERQGATRAEVRDLTFNRDLRVQDVQEALASLMASSRPKSKAPRKQPEAVRRLLQ